jgi:CrcB protein
MKQVLLVGCGGALGSMARYLLGGMILHRFGNLKFPAGTFTVNIIGCLLIGIFAGLAEKRGLLSPDARVFLITGICGGFTTFSAFAHENVFLLRRAESAISLCYILASITLGLIAVWVGMKIIPSP